jgi:DNA polymerase
MPVRTKSRKAAALTSPCGGEGTGSAAEYIPARASLAAMRKSVDACRGCGLWACGRGVFGEGPRNAEVLFVGEQPGDQEEVAGRPFVGPAGKVLDAALAHAGLARDELYLTNAVKHFKYERGAKSQRRIHKKPSDAEVQACHPWLLQEIRVVKPRLIVVLGATAAQSLLGKQFRVTQMRGQIIESEFDAPIIATVHPSSVLRAGDLREAARAEFFEDIVAVGQYRGR